MVTFIVEYRICHDQYEYYYENLLKLNVCIRINYHNLSYFFSLKKENLYV